MNIKKLGSFISGAFVGSFFLPVSANAVILVEPLVNTPNPEFQDQLEIPPDLPPNQVIPWVVPDSTGQQNFFNGTEFDINKISVILLNALTPTLDLDEDGFHDLDLDLDGFPDEVMWGDVNGDGQIGKSNIFGSITIDPDFITEPAPGLLVPAPRLDLTEGIIFRGEAFTFQFITSPDITSSIPGDNGPLLVGGTFEEVEIVVPEPSTFLGYIFVFGLGYWLKKNKPNSDIN